MNEIGRFKIGGDDAYEFTRVMMKRFVHRLFMDAYHQAKLHGQFQVNVEHLAMALEVNSDGYNP